MFPFARFPGVDTVLGPEMKSTGEVMGIDRRFAIAFAKSQIGGGAAHAARRAPCSSRSRTRTSRASSRRSSCCDSLGFKIIATSGTQRYLAEQGVAADKINKVLEGRPHIVDAIKNGGVQLVFNTTEGATALQIAARCAAPPSCIKCRTTPLFQVPSPRRRASKPISGATSRSVRCKAISAAGPSERRGRAGLGDGGA